MPRDLQDQRPLGARLRINLREPNRIDGYIHVPGVMGERRSDPCGRAPQAR
jgi:hypothetical protein